MLSGFSLGTFLFHLQVPTRQRVRIICKDNYKYEMAPPSAQEIDENGSGAPAPVQVETAITSSGTNHHMLYPRGSHLAPHHPHHPHHVQAAAGQFQA